MHGQIRFSSTLIPDITTENEFNDNGPLKPSAHKALANLRDSG